MAHEGFGAHVRDVEPEHQELPHLGNHDRDPSLASRRRAPTETTWAAGTHLNPPGNLSLAL
ncbi:hypothetical protein KI387_002648, partial [Taxus chinensis]